MSAKKQNAGLAAVNRLATAEAHLSDAAGLFARVLRKETVKFDPSTDSALRSEIEDFLGRIGWDVDSARDMALLGQNLEKK